jgi:tRNA (cytidine/uridine-2'-O-)-methyltransferase
LVRPLGFRVDEKTLRRAGLDYWQHLDWEVADHWDDLLARMNPPDVNRLWYFSRFATRSYTDIQYQRGDTFVFGAETSGLPSTLTDSVPNQLLRIPTTDQVRSLNLATSVGITAFEAARQLRID